MKTFSIHNKKFLDSIKHPSKDEDLCNWIAFMNGMTLSQVKNLPLDTINKGYCEDYAAYYNMTYNIPVYWIQYYHFVLRFNDKWYDTYNPEGVGLLTDLVFVKNNNHLKSSTEEELLKRTVQDDPLSHEIYRDNKPIAGYKINDYIKKYE